MLRALLRKQFLELRTLFFRNRKTGQTRTGAGLWGMGILYVLVFATVGFLFFEIGSGLASVLVEAGYGWMYFCIMAVIALLFGTLGSVFNTYAGLYQAKDNDFLFSLPIKPSLILASRLVTLYLLGLLYEALVLIPAYIAYAMNAGFSVVSLVSTLLLTLLWGFPVLALTCLLGWVIALIASRLRNKSFLTVIISLTFIGLYYAFIFRMDNLFDVLASAAMSIGDTIQGKAKIIYYMGLAFTGDISGFLLSALFCVLCFALTFMILSRGYLRLSTVNRGEKKKAYVEKQSKTVSPFRAFFLKEWKRFTSSSTYMLNCGLGSVFALAAVVALIIKYPSLSAVLDRANQTMPEMISALPVLCVGAVCLLCSTNTVTAPSVSLEGKNLWIAQSLPVDPKYVLWAKVALQLVVTLPAAVVLTVALCIMLHLSLIEAIMVFAANVLYVLLCSLGGLVLNLKNPNFTWTNEVYPIKQSSSVFFALFGGWILSAAVTVPYIIWLYDVVNPCIYVGLEIVVYALASVLLIRYVNGKGSRAFAQLS